MVSGLIWIHVTLYENTGKIEEVHSEYGESRAAPHASLVNMYRQPVWVLHAFSTEPSHDHLSPQMWEDNYKYSSSEKRRGLEKPMTCRVLLQGSQDVVLICPFPLRGQTLVWGCQGHTNHHLQFQIMQRVCRPKKNNNNNNIKNKTLILSKVLSEVRSKQQVLKFATTALLILCSQSSLITREQSAHFVCSLLTFD